MKLFAQPHAGGVNPTAGLALSVDFNITTGPHGDTQRGIYTVGAGKIAHVIGFHGSLVIVTAPTADGDTLMRFTSLEPSDVTRTIGRVVLRGELHAAPIYQHGQLNYWIREGHNFQIRTEDGKTGGTVAYNAIINLIEYNI